MEWKKPIYGRYKIQITQFNNPINIKAMMLILTKEQVAKIMTILDIYLEDNRRWLEQKNIEQIDIIANYLAREIKNNNS